jgi:hypothetical protein
MKGPDPAKVRELRLGAEILEMLDDGEEQVDNVCVALIQCHSH